MAVMRICVLLLVVAMAGGGCARRGLIQRASSDSVTPAIVVGDARQALAGEEPSHPVRAELFRVGLGEAADEQPLVFWGGEAFSGRPAKAQEQVDAMFALGVPRRIQPTACYDFKAGGSGWTLAELYEELAKLHGERFVVAGIGSFNAWPPFAGDQKAPKEPGIFVGVVTTLVDDLSREEKRIFIDDPADHDQLNVRSHTVAGWIHECKSCDPQMPEEQSPVVRDVRRIPSQSKIRRARLVVYLVDNWETQ
ncbi:hypothetical protein KQI84_08710 [bacterium]|nr:hypothetical protein [bacterium]